MGLLESHPELIEKYSALAHRFVQHGYLAPMNVLWTYYFINGMQVSQLKEVSGRDIP